MDAQDPQEAARAVLRAVAAARAAERAARNARRDFIIAQHRAGRRPYEIARNLAAIADELELTARERRSFGVSETTVHNTLNTAGVKEEEDPHVQ